MTTTEMTHKVKNEPNGGDLFEGITGNFHKFAEALFELTDDSLSNYLGHRLERNLIEIELKNQGGYVDVMVRDGGTGILDLNGALTISSRSGRETPMNEHGFGLKHALASVAGNAPDAWSIQTRTAEDAAANAYKLVTAPYDIGMSWSKVAGHGDITDDTGTVIRFRCPKQKFDTLKPSGKRGDVTFLELVAFLEEELRYTYANLLDRKEVSFMLTFIDEGADPDDLWITEGLHPHWQPDATKDIPPVSVDLGGGPLEIRCRYGSILRSEDNAFYYKGNMATSGVEIRINGRAIQNNLYSAIWGKAQHPTQNRFLAQIDLVCDHLDAFPATKSAKNGFVEYDKRLLALYQWIRSNIPEPPKEETKEQMLVRLLAEKKLAEPGTLRVSREEGVFECLGLKVRADLFVSGTAGITLYEAKASGSKAENLYQLLMYYDGCVADGKPVRSAILIAHHHPKEVHSLMRELNRRKGPDGQRYHFALSTWESEGITPPSDAA
jgi:hypothetical protein